MDHDALENEMIDVVNRHSWDQITSTGDLGSTPKPKKKVFTKTDVRALTLGLKRMVLALLTAVLFALAVYSFIAVATVTGYWAVVLFISAIVLLIWAFVLLYAQGISHVESKGDSK